MKELPVYNLEFPEYVNELNIVGYKFKRVKEYAKTFAELQHRINVIGCEFPIIPNTGTHQITASVELPEKESLCILPWEKNSNFTKLQDVLLFLTIFSGRNVFALNPGEEKYPLRPDPREHFYGGQFRLSVINNVRWRHKDTGEIVSDEKMNGHFIGDYLHFDNGLEITINKVLETIASKEWQKEFNGGYFLFLFRQAMKQSDIEPAFILCWTIWEHLFTLHNRNWLDNTSIEQISGDKKISFILNNYFHIDINDKARKEIKRITRARNRLIHFGIRPDDFDLKEMELVIRLTEQLISTTLKLQPSNAFNSFEKINGLFNKNN